MDNLGWEVFLSYSLADGKFARMICEKLEEAGISVFYLTRDIEPGMSWEKTLKAAILKCQLFIVILSEISMRSEHVLNELRFALQHHTTVLPVLVEAVPLPDELRYYLTSLQLLNASGPSLETAMDELVRLVPKKTEETRKSAS